MAQETIAPRLWQNYERVRERRMRVDEVFIEFEREVVKNSALLGGADLFPEWRSLANAFPEKPLDVSIAVIGVFRGGKSTLINALLGASLLPAAHAATTATITKIRYRPSGFLVRVQYTGPEEETFRASQDELLRTLERPLDEVLTELRDSKARGGVEALLGMYGAVGANGVLIDARVAELHTQVKTTRALPPLPLQSLLGRQEEHLKDDVASIEEAVRPYVMFTGADGEYNIEAATRQFMISSVTIEGPFDALASKEGSAGILTLVDTPGLEDPRPFVKKMVHSYLRAADCVCLNVSNHGNISATDVDVLRLLLNETLHRKLIVTLAKVDTLGASDAEVQAHVVRQRKMLEARVGELHPGDPAAARRFIDETPVLPVVALAALERARQARGTELDKKGRRLVEDYPSAESDGTEALFGHIRQTLDGSARLAGVVGRAEEALGRLVENATAALKGGIDDRTMSADQLRARAEELTATTEGANAALNSTLTTMLKQAKGTWQKQRADDRERFNNKLPEVALAQVTRVDQFVADATADQWKHWKRLRAVASRGTFEGGRDSQLRDDIAHNALGGVPSLLRGAVETIVNTAVESTRDAATLAEAASSAFSESASGFNSTQLADVRHTLHLLTSAELNAASAEYRNRMYGLTTKFFEENAVEKMSQGATDIVLSWIEAVRDMSGRGVQAKMHNELRRIMLEYVKNLPNHVGVMFGDELDNLFREAEEGALEVYKRVASKSSSFLSERLEQLEEAARRAQTTEATALEEEKRILSSLQERLSAAVADAEHTSR